MKKMIIVLTVVSLLSGFILAFVFNFFSPLIEKNQKKALDDSLRYVLPEVDKIEKIKTDKMDIYKGLDKSKKVVAYAILVIGGGYQGTIKLLVSVTPDFKKIIKINVLEEVETPGLGARIEEEWFKKQFEGLNATIPISYVKNIEPHKSQNQVKAISGATISSRSVVNTINERMKEARKILNIK